MPYDFKDVKVLIVESAPPLYELLRGVLVMFTVQEKNIFSAYSAEEGFKKFCTESPDLMIVDWLENPDRGIFLTRQIRTTDNSPNKFVPILMTAGSGHLNRVIKARDAGVSEYLVKPFTAKILADKIERIVEKPRPFVVSEAYTGPDRRSKNIPHDGMERRKNSDTIATSVAFQNAPAG